MKVLAVIADEADLIAAWRARAEELNVSRAEIDRVAGLPSGYAGKMLCVPPVKYAGPQSFWNVCGALGLAVQLVVDPDAVARFAGRMDQRDSKNARLRRMIHKSKIPWLLTPERARELAMLCTASMTSKQRKRRAKRAARARWAKISA